MGLYYHFPAAITFTKLFPFIQIGLYKFETIMQIPCLEGFDENHFGQNIRAFKIIYYSLYILCSNHFLHLPN